MTPPVYVICCEELAGRRNATLGHLARNGVYASPWRVWDIDNMGV